MSTTDQQRHGSVGVDLLSGWQTRATAIVAAIVINVIILTIGRLVVGEFPVATVSNEDQTIGYGLVIGVTALNGLAAWALLVILERKTSRATAIWTAIAGVVFVLSLFGPLDSGVDTESKVVLTLLHVGAAAAIVPLMRRSSVTRNAA